MRTSRFLLLSIVLFFICFWFSGGSNIILHDTKELGTKLQDQIHPSENVGKKGNAFHCHTFAALRSSKKWENGSHFQCFSGTYRN